MEKPSAYDPDVPNRIVAAKERGYPIPMILPNTRIIRHRMVKYAPMLLKTTKKTVLLKVKTEMAFARWIPMKINLLSDPSPTHHQLKMPMLLLNNGGSSN